MSDSGKNNPVFENIQILNSFTVSDNEDSSLTSDSIVTQESSIQKETLDDFLFKEAIVSTRRLDDMVILNGDIDNLPAQFVYKSIESESKASRAYNCTIFQSYTNKIDYSTLERKLSSLNKETEKQNLNQIPKVGLHGVMQSVIESKIIESFAKYNRETPTNSMNSTVRVKRHNGKSYVRSRTTEKRNIKPRRVSKTRKGPGVPRNCKIRQTGETCHKLPKTPLYAPAIKPNELATDGSNIRVVKSDQLLPSCQSNELGITKAVTGLIVKNNFKSMSSTISLAENVSLIKQILPAAEIEETHLSESNIILSNVDITQHDQGRPLQVTTNEAKIKKTFSEINVNAAETNILLTTTENKIVSPRPENIDVLLKLHQSTEFSALVQETHDATDEPETDHLPVIGESSDLISQPGTKVSFVLDQYQCPTSTECVTSINQEIDDTESDYALITGERSGLFQRPEIEQTSFENSSVQLSITEFEGIVKLEKNDTPSESDNVNSESKDTATEEILTEFLEGNSSTKPETIDITSDIDQLLVANESIIIPEDILSENEETSASTEIVALINSENTDTTSETDRLIVSGESTDILLDPENSKIATDTSEIDPLLIKTEVTDLTRSPENLEITLESDQVLTTAEMITPLKPETKHLQANKTKNANALVHRNKNESLSNTNAVAKSKISSGIKYTKLSTDIQNMLSSNNKTYIVQKLKMHIVKKPGDLFEILPLSFFRKNKKAIKKCKPLTITLIDYKVYAKMTKLHEYEVFKDILHLTTYVQQKSKKSNDYFKKDNTKTNVNKPKVGREETVRGEYHKSKLTTRIEIVDLASKIIEVYELDARSNIASFKKNELVDDFDLEDFKAGIGQKEPTRAIVCCWFKRRALVKLLCTKFGQHASFSLIKNRHTCPFGKCKCCVQCQNENGESPSLPNMIKHDHTVKSLYKTTTLSIPSEPQTLIDKALAYAQNLSFKYRLSVISDNIISSAQKQIQALNRPWLNNEIIEVRNLSSGIVEIFDVDSKGDVQTLTKERTLGEQSNLFLLGDIIDVSKKSSSYNVCCWNKREQLIEKLRNLKVKPETLNFIRKKHTCPIDNCHCCCPYVQVINLKNVNNDTLSETSPIADQQEKNIQTNPIPNISIKNENNTDNLQNKDDNLMQSIIDEEISILIKDSNSPLSTLYKVDTQEEAANAFPKSGSSGLVRPSEKEVPVIEIFDDDDNESTANVSTNDAIIPGPPPLVQSQQPPIVEVNTIITQILNRFQGLRLNIGEKGQVQAVLQNTLDNVSTLELSLLKQILSHAQSLVDKYNITSNANLSSMMGLPGNPQSQQLYNEQAASRVAQYSVAPPNMPMASIPTKVPLERVQSNRLTRPTLIQTPMIKNVYSCQTNPRPNPVSQNEHFYQPNSISRTIPIKQNVDSQQQNPNKNPEQSYQCFQPDPRMRTYAKPTISVNTVGSNQPQTTVKPASAQLSNLRKNLPKMTKPATPSQSSDRLLAIPRLAPKPISELANLTLANMLSSNTYKKPNFPTNNVNLERISAPVYDVPMATSSVGTTTVDIGNKATKKRKKEGLQKSYEMLSRIQPVVLSNPPPLRPFRTKKVTETNNALNKSPRMMLGNNSETFTHVISNTGASNFNPIPVLSNVVSLKENPTANLSVEEPRTYLESHPSRPKASCSNQNETTRSLDQNSSSSTDSATDLETHAESSCVAVWYRKPTPEDLLDETQASSSKHKLPDDNKTQLEKKRKLSQDPPLDFPMPKIKEEDEDDIIFF